MQRSSLLFGGKIYSKLFIYQIPFRAIAIVHEDDLNNRMNCTRMIRI